MILQNPVAVSGRSHGSPRGVRQSYLNQAFYICVHFCSFTLSKFQRALHNIYNIHVLLVYVCINVFLYFCLPALFFKFKRVLHMCWSRPPHARICIMSLGDDSWKRNWFLFLLQLWEQIRIRKAIQQNKYFPAMSGKLPTKINIFNLTLIEWRNCEILQFVNCLSPWTGVRDR